jgi:hypothetical protein
VSDTKLGTDSAARRPRPAKGEAPGPAAQDGADRAVQLERDLDRLSLAQALADTEAATARVIDLTERLVDARQQLSALRGELERLRLDHHQYRAEQEAMAQSQAFRLASRIWAIRNALGL